MNRLATQPRPAAIPPIAVICFGDILRPQNGYAIRVKMLARRLQAESGDVRVYQFAHVNGLTNRDGLTVRTFNAQNTSRHPIHLFLNRTLGFDPFGEIWVQLKRFGQLWRYRHELKACPTVYVEGCLLFTPFLLMKLLRRRIILDTHCMNKAIALRLIRRNRLAGAIRLVVWHVLESFQLRAADELIYVSEADRAFAEQHYHVAAKPCRVIPNEVEEAEVERFTAAAADLRHQHLRGFKVMACMVGDLGAIQNSVACDYIVSTLAPATPYVHYLLVGANPNHRPDTPNVTFTGFVEHLAPYLLAADVCIAPLEVGSGTKTKMLDYMKYQKPIIATPVGAEGLDTANYPSLRVVELSQFVRTINELGVV